MKSNSQKQPKTLLTPAAAGALKQAGPFLKWAGGKTQLLSTFDQYIPDQFRSYYEPFTGGGAMFFHMHGRKPGLSATLADLNDELINCYSVIRDDVESLITVLKEKRNERDYFYEQRALDPLKLTRAERAGRLIYLNKTCFNGLYRVNSRGQFNVPFGSYRNPRTCDEDNLRAVSRALMNVAMVTGHFKESLAKAGRGDFVYLDPPYQPLSATANFTSYTSKCFGQQDQAELAEIVRQLHRRGCNFMLSNSDNDLVRELYSGFRLETVYATRAINCRGDRRGKVSELLVLNY